MYNTPANNKNHMGGSKGNRKLFRSLGVIFTIALLIGALKFASNRQGFDGLVCFLAALVILLFVFAKSNPSAKAWLGLLGIVVLIMLILGFSEM